MILKASAAIKTILILLSLSLSFTTLIFGQEVYVDPNTGISISFQINKRTFPECWKAMPINAYGETLDLSEYERGLKIVKKAISKYPAEVLKNNISKIYVLKTIKFYGVEYGGTNSDNAV